LVQAGRELAAQVAAGRMPAPARLYVATGTMGSAAGLALGLALSGLPTEVQAVRVSHTWLCNEASLRRTMAKVTAMLRRVAPSIPADLPERANIRLRHGFFAGGYAHTDEATEAAIVFAATQLGLVLESTYTGKAMAALLHDLGASEACCLFWNTCNSARLPRDANRVQASTDLPSEFSRYFS
jgi:D-cysteine desulfhydrase